MRADRRHSETYVTVTYVNEANGDDDMSHSPPISFPCEHINDQKGKGEEKPVVKAGGRRRGLRTVTRSRARRMF